MYSAIHSFVISVTLLAMCASLILVIRVRGDTIDQFIGTSHDAFHDTRPRNSQCMICCQS